MDSYLQAMSTYGFPKEKEQYFLHIQMTMLPSKEKLYTQISHKKEEVEIKVKTGKNRLFYESNYLAVYQDENDIYTVVHPKKMIIHQRPEPIKKDSSGQLLSQHLSLIQQGLISRSKAGACKDTVYEGKPAKVIVLLTSKEDQEQYHIKTITNYFLPAQNKIIRQVIEFAAGHRLEKQIVVYHTLDFSYQGKIPKSARTCVFESNGKLLSRYKGYSIEEE